MAIFRPASRLNSADLPTLGRPMIATFRTRTRWRSCAACHAGVLVRPRVGVSLSLQLPDAVEHINDTGNKREQPGDEDDDNEGQETDLQHDPGDRAHLADGGDFSGPA